MTNENQTKATEADAVQVAAARSAPWNVQFQASARAVMPNGGTVTMAGPPGHSFEEALVHLDQTHALYLEWGGWGGGG